MGDVQDRLDHPANLCNKLVEFRPLHSGKQVGDVDLPPALRTLVASAAQLDTQEKVAEVFELSQPGVSHIVKREVAAGRVESKNEGIRDKALDRLASLFETAISEESLGTMKPREAVSAAKDLATVVEKVTPKANTGPNVQFIVFQPRVRSEDEYDTIDLPAITDGRQRPR